MSDNEVVEVIIERRLNVRHRAKTKVSIRNGKESKMCLAKNLSATGVGVQTEGMGLKKGMKVELSFAIDLGKVTKVHRRMATVVHVTNGITGLAMEKFLG